MLCRTVVRRVFSLKIKALSPRLQRNFHDEFTSPDSVQSKIQKEVQRKYKVYKDEDSTEIFDVIEEKQRFKDEQIEIFDSDDPYQDINLKRGIHGVYDIQDLVNLLERENGEDIVVISVPKQIKYVDYMCIVTGRSFRHMKAMAAFVRKVYKLKRAPSDALPKIEGESSSDWMALDLGNIALHIFSPKARNIYDLELLWSVGPEYDEECNKPEDPLLQLFEQNTILLNSFKPPKSM